MDLIAQRSITENFIEPSFELVKTFINEKNVEKIWSYGSYG